VLSFDSCFFFVDFTKRSGGLAIFLCNSSSCQLVYYSTNHITVEITDLVLGLWRLNGYYGYPNGERRRVAWDFLRHLSGQQNYLF